MSTPPRLRPAAVLAAAVTATALLLTACGGGQAAPTGEAAPEPAAATHTVEHEFGTSEIPTSPERIVALDEYAAMSLLSVGLTPATVFASWGSVIGADVLAEAGTEVVASGPEGPNPETVLAQTPDLVVFTSIGDRTSYDVLSDAVATVPLPMTSTPWQDNLAFLATTFDAAEETARITAAIEAGEEQVRAAVTPGTSVSVLMSYGGILAGAAAGTPSSSLLTDTGFTLPAAQQAADPSGMPYRPLSAENLGDEDADLVAVFAEGVYDATAVTGLPTFPQLSAAQAGRVALVNGDMWLATHPFATYWIVADLVALAEGRVDGVGTEATAAQRYAEFTEAVA